MMTTRTNKGQAAKRAWMLALFVIVCLATYYVTVALTEASQMLSATGR